MSETVYGILHVSRVPRRTGNLLGDLIAPRCYKTPSAYVIRDQDGPEEMLVGLRGKVLDSLSPDDDGRPVCLTGVFKWNPLVGPRKRLGSVRRASVRFIEPADHESPGGES